MGNRESKNNGECSMLYGELKSKVEDDL